MFKPKIGFCNFEAREDVPDHCELCDKKLASNELYFIKNSINKFMCFDCLDRLITAVNVKKEAKNAGK